jgi:hypothetical protein
MPIDYVQIKEGDLVDGPTLTARGDDIEIELNSLEETSVMPYGLHREHLQTTVVASERVALAGTTNHTYNSTNEPYPGYGVNTSWKVINTAGSGGGGTQLSVTFTSPVNMTVANAVAGGIVVLFNTHLITITTTGGSVLSRSYAAAFFAIQFQVSGTWYTLRRTERYVSSDISHDGSQQLAVFKDVPIRTLILPSDVTGKGNEIVTGIRGVVSVEKGSAFATPVTVALRQASLTAIALRAGSI